MIGILFSVLIIQRGMATNRYALSTNHLGVSILGAYLPGAGVGWISPILLTIVFKVGLHTVIVSQPRYFLAVVALELLVIAIVWDVM